jgi:hypothetical protein
MQGGKGGDFLSDFLKKYYPNLAWRKALWIKKRVFFIKSSYKG